MKADLTFQTQIKEVLRFLGYRKKGEEAPPEVLKECRECLAMLEETVTPRYVHAFYDLQIRDEESTGEKPVLELPEAGLLIRSAALGRNLKGCTKVCLFAATIGSSPDRLIARESVRSMSRAVVLQAAAAAMVEAYCDEVNRQIAEEAASEGLYCRPRFSPGYGDVPLTVQTEIAQILQMGKKAGITLTKSLLMMPSKSVTALVGLSPQKKECVIRGCEACGMRERCDYSRV